VNDLQERRAFTKGFRKGLSMDRKDKDLIDKVADREQEIFAELFGSSPSCARCGGNDKLTLDHIVPKSYLRDFGVNPDYEIIEENYQLLCNLCNAHKSNKPDFTVTATKTILLALLNEIK
jgi:5-methylcytosine-specific restriction endonuclease McrA